MFGISRCGVLADSAAVLPLRSAFQSGCRGRLARGFTLLEMLIGLTLVGFILVLLFAALRLGTHSWDVGEVRDEVSSQRALVINFLRRTLEQSYPLSWKVDGKNGIAFAGTAANLDYFGPVSSRSGVSGNYLINLSLGDAPDTPAMGRDLIMRWHFYDRLQPGFAVNEEGEDKALLRGVEAIELAYFGTENDTAEAQWQDQWLDKLKLPKLIRLRLKMANGDVWPEIIIAPRLADALAP